MNEPRICPHCHAGAEAGAAYCAHCGHAVVAATVGGNGVPADEQPTQTIGVGAPPVSDAANGAAPSNPQAAPWQAPPTAHQVPPDYAQQPPIGWQQPVYTGPPPPPHYPPAGMGAPQPPSGRGRGLLVGLIAAVAIAVLGVTAAVLLATSDRNNDATTATNVANAAVAQPTTSTPHVKSPVHGARPRHTVTTVVTQTTPPPVAHTPSPTVNSVSEGAAVQNAVERHWSLIESGNYAGAYDLFAPAMQARFARSGWISSEEQDDLTSEDVSVDPTMTSPTSATATIVSMRTDSEASGCHTWSGSYDLQKIDGDWRISKSNLVRGSC